MTEGDLPRTGNVRHRQRAQVDGPSTFYGIQILRGAAATLVVVFHACWNLQLGHAFTHITVPFFGNGGVDLFFLISGFVIVWTTRKTWWHEGSWVRFLERRLTRILPIYWILTSLKLALLLVLPTLFLNNKLVPWNAVASY